MTTLTQRIEDATDLIETSASEIAASAATLRAFTPRGDWATGTTYSLRDLVVDAGNDFGQGEDIIYVLTCNSLTSTNPAAELASGNWAIHQPTSALKLEKNPDDSGPLKLESANNILLAPEGAISCSNKRISSVANGVAPTDAATVQQLISQVPILTGTWEPEIQTTNNDGTVSYTTREGYYYVIGDLVFLRGVVDFSISGGTGYPRIVNPPFTGLVGNQNYPISTVVGGFGTGAAKNLNVDFADYQYYWSIQGNIITLVVINDDGIGSNPDDQEMSWDFSLVYQKQ